jgi:hypothetical protein
MSGRSDLQIERKGIPLVMAEILVRRSGRHNERVVRNFTIAQNDSAPRGINPGRFGQQDICVLPILEHVAQRRGYIRGRKRARRNLVEQRLNRW